MEEQMGPLTLRLCRCRVGPSSCGSVIVHHWASRETSGAWVGDEKTDVAEGQEEYWIECIRMLSEVYGREAGEDRR